PPSAVEKTLHSIQAITPSRIGASVSGPRRYEIPSNLSGILLANRREISSWSLDRMLTTNAPLSLISPIGSKRLSTLTRHSRGSSETEQKALAVRPRTTPSGPLLVMTVTLLAKDA